METAKDFYQQIKERWPEITKPFECGSKAKSTWQIINTLGPFFGILILMHYSMSISYWITLALSFLLAGFWLRTFVLFHDCCHGSFFKSRRANSILGFILGVLVLTPYHFWKKSHAIHHANAGNLEMRGIGDISTMTVQEYLEASRWKRFVYRVYRHPLVQFLLGPLFFFAISYRFSGKYAKTWKKERRSVMLTNLSLFALYGGLGYWLGWFHLVKLLVPAFTMTTGFGVWLFYIQHQFEQTYWSRQEDWDYVKAALKGASFYRLPGWLNWFSGNIGFHHVHHLNPRIPNYRLAACHHQHQAFQMSTTLTFWSSLKLMFLGLWDEQQNKMISFAQLRKRLKEESS